MERDLKNKTVLITGGATGIGFAIAEKYLSKGVRTVIIVDIDDKVGVASVEKLNSKYGSNKAEFYKGDVTTDLDAVSAKIFKKYTHVDVLINNAGILNEYKLRGTININVTALLEWSYKFFEHMRKDKGGIGGTMINLASIYGFRIDQYLPIYQASKYAVFGFTKSFGHPYRYEKYGIRVVAICPGFTETMLVTNVKMNDDPTVQKDFDVMVKGMEWQKVDSVSNAAVEVFEKAPTGTAWLIEGAKPIVSV
jgi:15-hydroxyprostaglandin dehydrogenase (NAD)